MFEYTRLPETVRYDDPSWPGFYVLIVPNTNATEYNLYLTHEHFAVVQHMAGFRKKPDGTMITIDELVEHAAVLMDEYLPDFVKVCCMNE